MALRLVGSSGAGERGGLFSILTPGAARDVQVGALGVMGAGAYEELVVHEDVTTGGL